MQIYTNIYKLYKPTPAAARYMATGQPSPPIPTINTLPFLSLHCPGENEQRDINLQACPWQ